MTQVPFYDPSGKIFTQTDGISMGSPLEPSISEFYSPHIKSKTFNTIKKPKIYLRAVGDIFIVTQSFDETNLKQTLV